MIHLLLALLLSAQSHALTLEPVKFVSPKRFEHAEGLPPKLIAVFEIPCNQTFLKTVRHEQRKGTTDITEIHVGGIVAESLASSCAGKLVQVKAEAGTTFSGRAFETHPILADDPDSHHVVDAGKSSWITPRQKKEQKKGK